MTQTVPWIGTAGVRFGEVTPERAIVHLPGAPEQHKHSVGRTLR